MSNEKLIQLIKLLDIAGYKVASINPEESSDCLEAIMAPGRLIIEISPVERLEANQKPQGPDSKLDRLISLIESAFGFEASPCSMDKESGGVTCNVKLSQESETLIKKLTDALSTATL